jgi:hypothetical protein
MHLTLLIAVGHIESSFRRCNGVRNDLIGVIINLFGADHLDDVIKIAGNGSLISRRNNRLNGTLVDTIKAVYCHFHKHMSDENDARRFTVKLLTSSKTGCATMPDIGKILSHVTTHLCSLQEIQIFFRLDSVVIRGHLLGV